MSAAAEFHAEARASANSRLAAFVAIPEELKKRRQWVLWHYEDRGKPKLDKVPYQPNGRRASVDRPRTWSSFEGAHAALRNGGFDGIGYVFSAEDPYCGCDLDGCRDPSTGTIKEWAWDIIRDFDSYAEVSPSGRGVHLIGRGRVPKGRKTDNVEIYSEGRFFTVTGERIDGTPATISEVFDAVEALWHRLTEQQRQRRGRRANGAAGPEEIGAKLHELLARDERFRASWEHRHADWPDQSLSCYDLSLVSIAARHGWSDTELALLIRAHRKAHGDRAKGRRADYVERTIALAREDTQAGPAGWGPAAKAGPAELARLEQSDTGNADRLLARFGHDLLFATHAAWFVWDGCRWLEDERRHAVKLAQRTARLIFEESQYLADKDDQERRAKWAVASQNKTRIDGMLAMAAPHVAALPAELDADLWLFNVANGTLDLRTGQLRPHRREDRITKLAPVAYDPEAAAPIWERFLRDIFAGDEELIRFVQRAAGYSLTGDISEQVMFILHGGGSNGKSTLLEIFAAMLGDYSQQTPTDTFMAKDRSAGSVPNDIARLRGARCVSMVESERDRRLAESLVKQATGGDRMTARFLHREFFEFTPTFKLWLATNHKPEVRGGDDAIWRRLRLIPFAVKFWRPNDPERPEGAPLVDKGLKTKLLAELPAILAWAVRGCLDWQRHGLEEPKKILQATAEYRSEMDRLSDFLTGRCDVHPDHSIRASDLYAAYKDWCAANGEDSLTGNAFGRALTDRGFGRDSIGGGAKVRRGLSLKGGD